MLNNKGQIAETITWIVATMIIVITLIIFIFISVQISNSKNLSLDNVASKAGDFLVGEGVGGIDRLEIKTTFALSLKDDNKDKIREWINEK